MPPSLLDRVDLAGLRWAASRYPEPLRGVFACLFDAGVLQHDPADPGWDDRDRVVVGGRDLVAAAAGAFDLAGYAPPEAGFVAEDDGRALAVACGLAAASALDGGVFRVWCLLAGADCDDGWVWEAARAAADGGYGTLTTVLVGAARPPRELLAAAGWAVVDADGDDVCELLGSFDQATARSGGPQVVAVR